VVSRGKRRPGSVHGIEILHRRAAGRARRSVPLLFLHGAFAGAWCWDEHFLPWFAGHGYDAYALSFRGHGESDGEDDLDEFGIADYVQDLRAVLAELPGPPVLLGHSMGGFVAMEHLMGETAPGLVLMASVPPAGLLGPSLSLAVWNPRLTMELALIQNISPIFATPAGLHDALFSRATCKTRSAQHYGRMSQESRRATLDMHNPLRLDAARLDSDMPVLVLGAEHDSLISPAFVRSTARTLGARAEILPETGHGIMLDAHWEGAAERILFWLRANGH